VPADHQHERVPVERAQPLERLEAVDPAHLHVEEDDVRMPRLVRLDRVDTVRHRSHFVPLVLEQLAEHGADPLLVVGDEDATAHCAAL